MLPSRARIACVDPVSPGWPIRCTSCQLMVATVCFGLFVALTITKVIAGVVQYRRRRPRTPCATVLMLGMGMSSAEPRRCEPGPAYRLAA